MEDMLTVKDVGKTLAVGYRKALALCLTYDRGEKGGIKSVRVGRVRRIRPLDLEGYLNDQDRPVRQKKH